MKPNINSVKVHPQLSIIVGIHSVDGELMGAGLRGGVEHILLGNTFQDFKLGEPVRLE